MKNELQFDLNNYFKQFPLIQDHVKYTSVLDKGNIFDCVKLIKKWKKCPICMVSQTAHMLIGQQL